MKKKWSLGRIFVRILVTALSLYCLLPLFVTLLSSLADPETLTRLHRLFPLSWSLRQYETALLRSPEYMTWFWNSLRITAWTLLINLPVSLLAGYGFAKFDFKGKNALFFVYIVVMLMPFQATLVPQYLTIDFLGLMNTRAAVFLPNGFSAFGAFLMTQYIRGIDNQLIEAARMEGMSQPGIFMRVIVPLSRPAIAALFILVFLDCWSVIEQPMIFITDAALEPLSIKLGSLAFSQASLMYAGGVIFLFLPLLIYLFGYDDLVEGISLGSVK